jgi:anti-sigma regulatory factor (Ser/Thr protein kinase)
VSVLLLQTQDVGWYRDDLTGARAAAGRLAERVGLGGHRAAEVVLAVSEVVSNLVKHAVAGAIVLRIVQTVRHTGIEFLALDGGPGIGDVAAAMGDGRSTTGTLGIGLGTIARLADAFDLHSIPGQGTVVLARFWPRDALSARRYGNQTPPEPVVQGVTRPINGALECGDGWAALLDEDRTPTPAAASAGSAVSVMLCDGLGHGPLAQTASWAAIRAFRASRASSPHDVVQQIHQGLAGTRGAAVAVARIEPDQARVLFCGVGDIAGAIMTSESKTSLPTRAGTAGHRIGTLHTSTHPLPPGSALVLHSDGLSGRWSPQMFPGILHHSPAVIAGHLLRAVGKYHDDASTVVAKGPW